MISNHRIEILDYKRLKHIRNYYDELSGCYLKLYGFETMRNYLSYLDIFIEKGKRKIKNILDLGCGIGIGIFYLKNIGRQVVAIDISEKSINLIKFLQKFPEIEFIVCIIEMLPFKDNVFDEVISISSLDVDNINLIKQLQEICRISKSKIYIKLPSQVLQLDFYVDKSEFQNVGEFLIKVMQSRKCEFLSR